jgi:hypothetical protein
VKTNIAREETHVYYRELGKDQQARDKTHVYYRELGKDQQARDKNMSITVN